MKFTLTIELGNDAAQTYGDIQFMLRRMAGALTHVAKHAPLATDGGGKIADINGNSVGEWKIEDETGWKCLNCGNALNAAQVEEMNSAH